MVSERYVRRIEQGIARLTGDRVAKLASAFGLELHEFLHQIASALAAGRSAGGDHGPASV